MRAYELMVIIDGEADDEAPNRIRSRIEEYVAQKGGEMKNVDHWGRRRFAYEIDHKWDGVYIVMELVAPPGGSLDELERTLRLADDVVRHKLLRLPDKEAARRGLIGASA